VNTRDTIRASLIATVWGANFVVIDQGLRGFPPFLLLAARFLLVAFPLILFVPRPAPWRTILLIGGFMSLGQFSLLYLALHLGMPAGLASLLTQAQVIFTIVISSVFLGERPSVQQTVGVLIGLAGLATIALGYGSNAAILPLLLTLAASLSWSIGNVLSRRAKVSDAFGLVVWSALLVPLPALGLAFLVNGSHEVTHALTHIDLRTVWSTLYTVLGASLFGYVSWNKLLSRHPVSSVVPFTFLVPVVGIAAAWLAMGQVPTLTEVIGGVTQIAGVAIASIPGVGPNLRTWLRVGRAGHQPVA
jgi:O-acetylserine/cysteine efflux transporter